MKKELVKFLLSKPALTALVNNNIFNQQAPQSRPPPYIVVGRLPGTDHHHHMLAAAGLVTEFFSLSVYSGTSSTVEKIAEQVRELLDGFRGDMNGENVRQIHLNDEEDDKVNPTAGSEDTSHRIRQTYLITRLESVPTFP